MRKSSIALAVAALGITSLAVAANPHFIFATSSIDPGGSVEVEFKAAGLVDHLNHDYTLTANCTAVYACRTSSGRCAGPLRATVQEAVVASGTFVSSPNGQITASLTITPPPAPPGSCPPGLAPTLLEVSYSNITVRDVTNNITIEAGGQSRAVSTCPN